MEKHKQSDSMSRVVKKVESPFTREVVLNTFSKRDAQERLIADPKLEIVEIQAYSSDNVYLEDGGIVYEGNKLVILPFTELSLKHGIYVKNYLTSILWETA